MKRRPTPDAAADWALRRETGLDAAGERELAHWLAADPCHAGELERATAAAAVFDRAREGGATVDVLAQLAARARVRRGRRHRAVAGVFAVVLFGVFWMFPRARDTVAESAPVLSAELIRRLPDGSVIELGPGAEMAVHFEPALRRVTLLRGQAHFAVVKDSSRPFVVTAGGAEVRAVGTAFAVQVSAAAVEVVVTEGRVAVASLATVTPTLVDAGQAITLVTKDRPEPGAAVPLSAEEIDTRLAWRSLRIEFVGSALGEVVAQFNLRNRTQLVLADPTLAALRVSGGFRADNPEGFARIVAATFDLRTEPESGSTITLRRAR